MEVLTRLRDKVKERARQEAVWTDTDMDVAVARTLSILEELLTEVLEERSNGSPTPSPEPGTGPDFHQGQPVA